MLSLEYKRAVQAQPELFGHDLNLPPVNDKGAMSFEARKTAFDHLLFFSQPKPQLRAVTEEDLDLTICERWVPLEKQTEGKEKLEERQGGEAWHLLRKEGVTGSILANAVGMFGYIGLLSVWADKYCSASDAHALREKLTLMKKAAGIVEPSPLDERIGQERMGWGSPCEIHATATILKHLGPLYNIRLSEAVSMQVKMTPDMLKVMEEHVTKVWGESWESQKEFWAKKFIATSPDALGVFLNTMIEFVVEIKCGYGNRSPKLFTKVPGYYYLQCQAHCIAKNVKACLFVSWTPEKTRMWWVLRDDRVMLEALPLLMDFHAAGVRRQIPEPSVMCSERMQRVAEMCDKPALKPLELGVFKSCLSARAG